MTDEDNKKIENAKKKWSEANAAGDKAGMETAHKEAEAVRANYGYSGGVDGSQKISTSDSWIGTGTSKAVAGGTSTNYGTYEDDLKKLSNAQKQARINELKQARKTALHNLDAQEQAIKPTYQNARNMTSASSQTGARSFAEYLANRGLANSGASAQGEINRLSNLQNNLGNINTAEANAYRDIANQRTQVENDYASGLANANSVIAEQYYNNLLNYNQQQRAMVQQLQQQANYQYANDYQAQINNLLAQGYSPNSLEVLQLQALRGNKIASNYANANTASNALASIQAGNINYNNAAALGWTVEQAQNYYNNLLAQAQAQAQAEAEQQAFENYIKQTQLNNATKLNNAKIANYNDQINKRTSGNTTSSSTKTVTPNYSSQKSYIDNTYTLKDAFGDITGYDTNGILQYIQQENNMGRMSDSDAINLLYNYGMKEIADELIGG